MLSQLSQYQFLFNILLMFISVLQIAVTNETRERKQVSEQELQRSRKDSTYQIIKASLSASVARFRSGLGFSQSSDRNDLMDSSDMDEKEETVDRFIHFLVLNINKITSMLILILSSTFTSLISAVYFIYILFFIVFPEKMRKRNSLSMTLLLVLSFLHLAAYTFFQLPFFQEADFCIGSYCIPVWHTIGLTKLVLMDYDGAPTCTVQMDDTIVSVKCENPLSIRGMLPVMLIVVILYFQKMISNSDMYGVVLKSMKDEEKRAGKKREKILQQMNEAYVRRKEGADVSGV